MDLTSKGLKKPTDPEAADIVDLNFNADRINDYGMGAFLCTSGTRPAAPWAGLNIFETDTRCSLVWNSVAWVPNTIKVCTAATRPVPAVDGQLIYQTDTDEYYVWEGTSWDRLSTYLLKNDGVGPAAQTDYTTVANVIAVAVNVIAGRKYAVTAYVKGTQVTNPGTVSLLIGGATSATLFSKACVAGELVLASARVLWTAPATAAVNVQITAQSTAAAFRIAANDGKIFVEEVDR